MTIANAKSTRIRVLVVDDSAFMRKAISMMLESDPDIEVVDTARDGQEGLEKALAIKPDLVTMDIEMPRMDGLTALRLLMEKQPTPVMVVSSLSTEGAQATLEALELGAVDFIPKQLSYVSLDIVKIKEELVQKIHQIHKRRHILMSRAAYRRKSPSESGRARSSVAPDRPLVSAAAMPGTGSFQRPLPRRPYRIVAIGTSTGGPPALQEVITKLPADLPCGVTVVQHMPPIFTKSLADRLNGLSSLHVKEAEAGDRIEKGVVLIAPGDRHLIPRKVGSHIEATLSKTPDHLHIPAVDVMMDGVAEVAGSRSLGVILTGMGHDGLVGLRKLKEKGGAILAQDERTCVVYGMPRAIVEAELTDRISPIQEVARDIQAACMS